MGKKRITYKDPTKIVKEMQEQKQQTLMFNDWSSRFELLRRMVTWKLN